MQGRKGLGRHPASQDQAETGDQRGNEERVFRLHFWFKIGSGSRVSRRLGCTRNEALLRLPVAPAVAVGGWIQRKNIGNAAFHNFIWCNLVFIRPHPWLNFCFSCMSQFAQLSTRRDSPGGALPERRYENGSVPPDRLPLLSRPETGGE